MVSLNRWVRHLAAIAVMLMVGGCAASLPKTSKDFADVTQEMKVVAPMPTTFAVKEDAAFSSQEMTQLTHDIEREVDGAMGSLVRESQYKLSDFQFSDSALAADAELRTAIFEQHQAMAEVFAKLAKSKSSTIDIPYTASLDLIADRTGSDHLLFVTGQGTFQSTGAAVKEGVLAGVSLLMGGSPSMSDPYHTSLAAMLVDANRGKVVWYNQVSLVHDPRRPSELMITSQALTKPLLGKSKLTPDKSRDNVIIDKYHHKTTAKK